LRERRANVARSGLNNSRDPVDPVDRRHEYASGYGFDGALTKHVKAGGRAGAAGYRNSNST